MTDAPSSPNPFASPSSLPYELPDFARIRPEHYAPAIEAGFREREAAIDAIAKNPEPPTFENTLEAFERSGELLWRVASVLFALASSDATPEIEALEEEYAPKFAAHEDRIHLNSELYARVRAVCDQRDSLDLRDDQRKLLADYELAFRLAGAGLGDDDKARLAELNQREASLQSQFVRQLLADTNDLAVTVETEAELDGLDDADIAAAREAAIAAGQPGGYRINLTLPVGHAWLARLTNRSLRERIYRASRSRGALDNANNNGPVVHELLTLRAEKARLLGFETYADLRLVRSTAGSRAAVNERLELLAKAVAPGLAREHATLQELAGETPIEPWDWAFYAEQVRQRDYEVDEAALRPYFEADRVLTHGVFAAATLLYGLTFVERRDLVGHHPEARVFEVFDDDGSGLGLYLLDLYARDVKRGGAWMSTYLQQNELFGHKTVVYNILNVAKPPVGSPTLLTLDEVETLFHEFGHALHGLLAHTVYPAQAGTEVKQDFVEYPSQVNESWMLHPQILPGYARHVETDAPLPQELADRLRGASRFNQGFLTAENVAASTLDQALHQLTLEEAAEVGDLAEFEQSVLARTGLDFPATPPRYSIPYFQHIFGGGYAASYYGYLWSEVFDAASVDVFDRSTDLEATGRRFRDAVLGNGGSRDELTMVRDFLGADPEITPLLRRRGLLDDAEPAA
ncbi:M3 family metallopeptidase [Gulosibacter faecalis]|jgi:peptidyl-dipeptidase Dcp|uniref:M3 family metallopeptidase n=1 Tax=Gulosibacter faecalis TaxID=272240 RepID=A0ABW5V0B5_9MICO|nr:M3 family metallopeptidase [Gulosibacter faecalis]